MMATAVMTTAGLVVAVIIVGRIVTITCPSPFAVDDLSCYFGGASTEETFVLSTETA